tara:strand:- start:7 stop:894 length:888 start_codon:yes stop_codon:yes gene_type:complete
MEDFNIFIIGGLSALIINDGLKLLKKCNTQPSPTPTPVQTGGENKLIDLTNINPPTEEIESEKGIIVFADYKDSDKKPFKPMFENPLNAAKLSESGIHLVIPGLLPAPNNVWSDYEENKIFYMPNDFKPHFHGEAQHHMPDSKNPEMMGFDISRVFSVQFEAFINVENKKIPEYRENLQDFFNGKPSTPVETWIHWKIPVFDNNYTGTKEYPVLKVKKNSVIWWDYTKHHNLNFVSETSYNQNNTSGNDILFPVNKNKDLQVDVTIMDKTGTFYFLCSIGRHAELGHKIKIIVID